MTSFLSFLLLAAFFVISTPSVESFSAPHVISTPCLSRRASVVATSSHFRADTKLFYTNGDGDSGQVLSRTMITNPSADSTVGIMVRPKNVAQELRPMDLPRRSPPKQLVDRQRALLDVELSAGRVAMVVAMVLFGGELMTGLSLTTQVMGALR